MGKQTENKRADGKFAPKNKLGNRFQKGETGNRAGRPRNTRLTDALREKLAQNMPNVPDLTVAEAIAQTLIKEALKGNVQAAREIADRCEGKPKQAMSVDLNVQDWREMARAGGISEQDVITEAQRLIAESAAGSSDE